MEVCLYINLTQNVRLSVVICIFYRKRTTEIERKNPWVTQHRHRRRRRMLWNTSVECNSLLVYFFLYLQYIQDTRYLVLNFPITPLQIHLKFLNPHYDVRFKLLLKKTLSMITISIKLLRWCVYVIYCSFFWSL